MPHFGKLLVISLALAWACVVEGDTGEDYKIKYLDMMKGQKCHPGYKSLSKLQLDAADECSKMKDMASYLCYITCVYRTFGYVVEGKQDQLDFAMGDYVTMQAFDVKTREGRKSYWNVAPGRFKCGDEYINSKKAQFALKYDNADACKAPEEFFKCTFRSLTCNSAAADSTK